MQTLDDLIKAILPILPDAQIGEDNDGQLVIYTNLYENDTGFLDTYDPDGESRSMAFDHRLSEF
jgi:hypothetical protein